MSQYIKNNGEWIKIGGVEKYPTDFGTRAEFEAKKDDLPVGTVFTTTDEFEEGGKGGVGFIDTTNKIATFTGSCDWTATETCYLVIDTYANNGISTSVTINDVIIYHLTSPNVAVSSHYTFPIQKGDVVKATTYSAYKIDFYGMKY